MKNFIIETWAALFLFKKDGTGDTTNHVQCDDAIISVGAIPYKKEPGPLSAPARYFCSKDW